MTYKIFTINFGSTSTKIALFDNEKLMFEETLRHDDKIIQSFNNSVEQKEYRLKMLEEFLKQNNISLNEIDIFVGRGGLVKPLTGGTYIVNDQMVADLTALSYGDHVSNLGGIVAYELAKQVNKPAYIVDPVVVDEMSQLARVSGFKGIERKSRFHALNHKAVAKRYAKEINRNYEDLNVIVAHLGGGISIGLHKKGKVVDVNNALGGDGPFSPQRAGTLPFFDVIDYVLDSKKTREQMKKDLVSVGGLFSYLGTASGIEICERIAKGDKEAEFYLEALAYQINKEIGSLYFVAKGEVDAVIYTGGLVYQKSLVAFLQASIPNNITTIFYPGEDEMEALALGGLRVALGIEEAKEY